MWPLSTVFKPLVSRAQSHRQDPSNVAALPPEIFIMIFEYLLPPSFEHKRTRWQGSRHEFELFSTNADILHVCQVNRHWFSMGIVLLYHRVVLYSLSQLRSFRRTLHQSPVSRDLVHELVILDELKGIRYIPFSGWLGWKSGLRRSLARREYRKQRDDMRHFCKLILSSCPNIRRISLHFQFGPPWKMSLNPYILDESQIPDTLPLTHFLLTNSYAFQITKHICGLRNLRTLNLFGTSFNASFIQQIPSSLPRLYSLALIDSRTEYVEDIAIIKALRKIRSLRSLHVVKSLGTYMDEQAGWMDPECCPCPENLEQLSLVCSHSGLINALAAWSNLGGFSSTLRELRISFFKRSLPDLKIPHTLTTLMMFMDSGTYRKRTYFSILRKIRELMEKNTATMSSDNFKSLVLVRDVVGRRFCSSYSSLIQSNVSREERTLRELCIGYGVTMLNMNIPGVYDSL